MEEKEIWKDVVGFEGLYKVNQWGDIWSEYTHHKLSYSWSKDGYKQYNLSKNGKKSIMTAHRAVAMAFIPNPDNLPVINHKDEDKANCYYQNLEWCTYSYNNSYNGTARKRMKNYMKPVYQYDKLGELVAIHDSMREAARSVNSPSGNVSTCCQNKKIRGKYIRTVKGYVFSFEPLSKEEVLYRFSKASFEGKYFLEYKSKEVEQLTLNDEYVKTYKSCGEAQRQIGFSATQISRAARGYELGHTCHGFKWRYTK